MTHKANRIRKPFVYIAHPITGNMTLNVHDAMDVWDTLVDSGWVVPYCPGWSVVQDVHSPRSWPEWLSYCFDLIPHVDAMLRAEGASRGADKEEAYAKELGIPVFYDTEDLLSWAQDDPFGDNE